MTTIRREARLLGFCTFVAESSVGRVAPALPCLQVGASPPARYAAAILQESR